MAEPEDWPRGAVVRYTPKWASQNAPLTRMLAQEIGLVARATEGGVFVRYAGDGVAKFTDAADLEKLLDPLPAQEEPDGDQATG